jgi:magnesium chelatase family protein
VPRPGEVSLAHCGVLFLDELPEFDRKVLEVLRQPLESGSITISRAAHQADFPARFQLIAAMNPCPCGWQGHPSGKCHCSNEAAQRYRDRISGPLLDRIDMQIEVSAMAPDTMSAQADGESSATIARRVAAAHALQLARQGKPNQRLTTHEIDRLCILDATAGKTLRQAMAMMNWSARAYHRVLKVARTIADMAGLLAASTVPICPKRSATGAACSSAEGRAAVAPGHLPCYHRRMRKQFLPALIIAGAACLAACSPTYNWRDYSSPDAPYRIMFPAKPATHTRATST